MPAVSARAATLAYVNGQGARHYNTTTRHYNKRELQQRLAFAGLRRVGIAHTLRLVLILLR